ncbi:hypothetical protein [Geotalea toluenoxydans]|uniref:hypothetical protein n=1 Tax=Geotalea toluenoxydans TaxID=421624 RepID=UPI000A87F88D|nr:hypothetical protein [Geotalea toluenoxydans]
MARTRDILNRELPPWLNAVLVFGTLATVVYFEIKRPLRKMRQDKVTRNARNVFMSWTTAATIALTEKPVTAPLSRAVERYASDCSNFAGCRYGLISFFPWCSWTTRSTSGTT